MDPDKLVATVCEYLVNMRATNSEADWSSSPTTGTSRHAWLYRRASESCASDIMAFEFHRTVAPVVEAYRALVAQPVSAWGDVTSTEQHNEAIARLCYQFWLIAERHAPGQVVVPTNRPVGEPDDTPNYGTDELAPPPPVTVDTVLYECQMNIHLRAWRPAPPRMHGRYQIQHTIGPAVPVAATTTTPVGPAPLENPLSSSPGDKIMVHRTNGTTGAAYQRRAQFRITMATYQGRSTRPVPPSVINEVRQQIEASARHLINTEVEEPL